MKTFANYLLAFVVLFVLFIVIFYALAAVINMITPYTPDTAFVLGMAFGNALVQVFMRRMELK